MFNDDLTQLRHMIDAGKEAVELARGKTRDEIENERTLNLSLVRLIEVVGEAGSRVSPEVQAKHPSIPWRQVIGMRNRLIHGYGEIDHEILYETVTEDIPHLIAEIEKVLRATP